MKMVMDGDIKVAQDLSHEMCGAIFHHRLQSVIIKVQLSSD